MSIKSVLAAICCLVLFASCGEAPVERISVAQDALNNAKTSEAETYAPDAYQAAADTLRAALAAKEQADAKFKLMRSYKETEKLVARAEFLANEAAREALAEKEAMRLELGGLFVSARAVLDSAQVAIGSAPKGKGSRAEIDLMKIDLTAAGSALDQAQADFDAERFDQAKVKIMAAMEKARGVCDEIAAAIARKTK